jgi:hypothetical protein
MNNLKKILYVLSLSLLVQSCTSPPKFIIEALANTNFNQSLAENEISREHDENVYPFTLNYLNHYGCPIVQIQLEEELFTFLVDTGCERSWLFNNGITKLFGSVENFEEEQMDDYLDCIKQTNPEILENKSTEQLKIMFHRDLADFNIGFTIHHSFADFGYWPKDGNIDGVIGQDLMKKHSTVTFDFVDNLLIFDGYPIEGSVLPMIESEMDDVFIEFLYNGKIEYGFVDTGNYTFTPRSNFGKDDVHFDFKWSDDYSISFNGHLKKRFPWILTFNNIIIGDIEYNDIKGVYSNIWFSTYNMGAQNMLRYVNGIGCEFFRGHIIMFDYENNQLIIQ